MKFLPIAVFSVSLTAGLSPLLAQNPPAPAANLVTNGGFEQYSTVDNIWDGVDSGGYLAGRSSDLRAIAESGFRDMAMPISVTAGDLNGDGLVDIMTADTNGYYQVFFNSGTKTAPVFTNSEIVPFFLTIPQDNIRHTNVRRGPRINLFDWTKTGMLDLMVGDYSGALFFAPNIGNAKAPEFKQPSDASKIMIPSTKSGELWANLLTPAAYDFNKDGRVDLALGEGSYSANSIHLLLNQGSNTAPKFDEANRFYLAYGDGREHLTPTVVDYNGDGEMDILYADRDGKIGVYLNPGAGWKPGGEFKHDSDIKFGGADNLGGLVTVFAIDMNGDGLFDLLIGKTNGHIALATNIGTKTEPKFGPAVDLRGTDIWGKNIRRPSSWLTDTGYARGNYYAEASCVTDADQPDLAPPEGKSALKIAYFPSPNKNFKIAATPLPGDANYQNIYSLHFEWETDKLPGNIFVIRKELPSLKVGTAYTFSFKIKGNGVTGFKWNVGWRGFKKLADNKNEAGERGSVNITRFEKEEKKDANGTTNATPAWTTISKTFTIEKFKNPDLADLKEATAVVEIRGTLAPNTGVCYLDDLQLVEKK